MIYTLFINTDKMKCRLPCINSRHQCCQVQSDVTGIKHRAISLQTAANSEECITMTSSVTALFVIKTDEPLTLFH